MTLLLLFPPSPSFARSLAAYASVSFQIRAIKSSLRSFSGRNSSRSNVIIFAFHLHQKPEELLKLISPFVEHNDLTIFGCCSNLARFPLYISCTLTASQSLRSWTRIPADHTSQPHPLCLVCSNSASDTPTDF